MFKVLFVFISIGCMIVEVGSVILDLVKGL